MGRSMEKLVACCPYFSMKTKITTTKKGTKYENGSRNRSYRIKKKKKRPTLYINLKSFSLTLLKKKQPLTSPQACTRDQKKLKETYKKNKSVVRSPSQQQL